MHSRCMERRNNISHRPCRNQNKNHQWKNKPQNQPLPCHRLSKSDRKWKNRPALLRPWPPCPLVAYSGSRALERTTRNRRKQLSPKTKPTTTPRPCPMNFPPWEFRQNQTFQCRQMRELLVWIMIPPVLQSRKRLHLPTMTFSRPPLSPHRSQQSVRVTTQHQHLRVPIHLICLPPISCHPWTVSTVSPQCRRWYLWRSQARCPTPPIRQVTTCPVPVISWLPMTFLPLPLLRTSPCLLLVISLPPTIFLPHPPLRNSLLLRRMRQRPSCLVLPLSCLLLPLSCRHQ
mmetsp:Transcript_15656/g.37041  ORF Transcript_15656/g.37041 Transcript_15656/m.37041 type:complete len:287 (-) Transcript_15656:429-1289(-)